MVFEIYMDSLAQIENTFQNALFDIFLLSLFGCKLMENYIFENKL